MNVSLLSLSSPFLSHGRAATLVFFRLLDGRILDPVPDFGPEMALVDVTKELDALKSVNLSLFALVMLHTKQDHA